MPPGIAAATRPMPRDPFNPWSPGPKSEAPHTTSPSSRRRPGSILMLANSREAGAGSRRRCPSRLQARARLIPRRTDPFALSPPMGERSVVWVFPENARPPIRSSRARRRMNGNAARHCRLVPRFGNSAPLRLECAPPRDTGTGLLSPGTFVRERTPTAPPRRPSSSRSIRQPSPDARRKSPCSIPSARNGCPIRAPMCWPAWLWPWP